MSRVYQLAPSILSADFNRLGEQIQRVEKAECRWLHIDIMDGMFVPSISFGMPVVKSIRKESSLYFDVHMMVKDPERYVEEFQSCGADMITVHAEACRDLAETVKKIHETGADAGVAVNPDTPLSAVTDVMDQVEMILIMSVYPASAARSISRSRRRGSVRSAECWMKRDWSMCTFRSMAASTARPSMKSLRQVQHHRGRLCCIWQQHRAERARAAGKNFFIQQKGRIRYKKTEKRGRET